MDVCTKGGHIDRVELFLLLDALFSYNLCALPYKNNALYSTSISSTCTPSTSTCIPARFPE